MMNKIFLLMALPLLLAACSTTLTEDIETPETPDVPEEQQVQGNIVTIPELNFVQDLRPGSRSTLVYDYAKKVMHAAFVPGDAIGVYDYNVSDNYSLKADVTPVSDLAGHFSTPDEYTLNLENKYVAYMPYSKDDENSHHIKISYKGQHQVYNNEMYYYPGFKGNANMNEKLYLESEQRASAHLGGIDFKGTMPTKPDTYNHIYMNLIRLGAVARFYLKCPGPYVYDELQFVADTECFVEDGYIDLGDYPSINWTKKTHIMALELGENWDMTNPTTNKSYNDGVGYMICYYMLAPVDLRDRVLTLYLIAHEKGTTNKHYFKALIEDKSTENDRHPNLKANDFYQWTLIPNQDEPITFREVTVQEWEKGTEFTNGGTGTEGW